MKIARSPRAGSARSPSSHPPREPLGWADLRGFAIVLACYAIAIAGGDGLAKNPNELSRIELTMALVKDGSVAIDGPATVYGVSGDRAEKAGRTYTDKAPGLSLLAVPLAVAGDRLLSREQGARYPAYWASRNWLTGLLVALPAALLPFLLLRGNAGMDESHRRAFAVIFGLATPLFTYGTVFFGHVPAALLVVAAWWLVLRPGGRQVARSPQVFLGGGFLAGLAVTTEYPTAILAAVLLGTVLVRREGGRAVASLAAGFLIGILPLLLYNQAAFGSPWITGYAFEAQQIFREIRGAPFSGAGLPTAAGFWGSLFGSARGIFFYCPLLLLVPVGLARIARRSRSEAVAVAAASVLYIAFVAGLPDWQGGWSAATRHLIPLVMLWIYPLAEVFLVMQRASWTRLAFAALAGISVSHALLSLAFTPFFPESFQVPLAQVTLRCLQEGAAMRSWLEGFTGLAPRTLVVLWSGLAIAAVAAALVRSSGESRRNVLVPATMLVAILLDASLQWGLRPTTTLEQESLRAYMLECLGYPRSGMGTGAQSP